MKREEYDEEEKETDPQIQNFGAEAIKTFDICLQLVSSAGCSFNGMFVLRRMREKTFLKQLKTSR